MPATLLAARPEEVDSSADEQLNRLFYLSALELGLSKIQSQQAVANRYFLLENIRLSVARFETEIQRDAIVLARLDISLNADALRQLLEINLIASIALNSTIAIDADGDPVLLSILPIFSTTPEAFSKHLSQMVLFSKTIQKQLESKWFK